MSISIRTKLAIAFAMIAVFITIIVFIAMLVSFRSGFLQYVNSASYTNLQTLKIVLEENVRTPQEWQKFIQNKRTWHLLLKETFSPETYRNNHRELEKLSPEPIRNNGSRLLPNQRPPKPGTFYLLDADKKIIYGRMRDRKQPLLLPITFEKQTVAYIGAHKLISFSNKTDQSFVAKQTKYFLIIALGAGLIGLFFSIFLSRRMVSPIERLNQAMNTLMQHDYTVRVNTKNKDEIGSLMQSFNHLAATLGEHATSQQQWIADISHELRTPLATLRGEIEALQDGVRKLTPHRIDSLHEEILHIQRIVDDLHQLTLSDLGALRYQFDEIDIHTIIEKIHTHHQQALTQKDITLTLEAEKMPIVITGDSDRLYQLFSNLMQNSLWYTDPNGIININIRNINDTVVIIWEDSAPGIEKNSYGKLFNRLYREESSRNRNQGGSGLGLSIVSAIVKAHRGSISASASALGGLALTISFPLSS